MLGSHDPDMGATQETSSGGCGRLVASAFLLALLLGVSARADEAPVARIRVSSAPAGSSLGGRLVEGVMSFRGDDFLLTLRGIAKAADTVGFVRGLLRPRDIEGVFVPSDGGLRNANGVTVRFDPPLSLEAGRLEIELSRQLSPKSSGGQPGAAVE